MKSYLDYVNIRQGTQSQRRFGNGNTQPLVAVPNAMSAWAVQTDEARGSWYFHPQDRSFEGVRLTHMACNWLGDYGQIVFQPQTGEALFEADCRWSSFRPEETVMRPDYLRLTALRYRYTLELTPTERCCVMRISFRNSDDIPRFSAFTFDREGELFLKDNALFICTHRQDWKSCENFSLYCVVKFDCEIGKFVASEKDGGQACSVRLSAREVVARIGTSFLSYEQALVNLEREAGGSFGEVRACAQRRWEEKLSLIGIEADEAQKRTFYSCMYRLFLFPSKFYERTADGKVLHYCPHDGKIREGKTYVNNGFWDTARTVYPLLSLIDVPAFSEETEGFVNIYRDSGWLPKWPSPGETGLMPGTYIDAVIAEAAVKNIVGKEILSTAYEGMLKHATEEDPSRRYGRHGTADYNRLGYLPYDKYRECTNHTLDYVYGDFCISTVAAVLGDYKRAEFYRERSKNYRKLFDPAVGFIHAKDSAGNFKPNFNPVEWGGEYCEGGAYQNAFAVYHDVEGLAECYGGNAGLEQKLDELFARAPDFDAGEYRYELHEMSEMAAVDFGQCAISNQPSFHLPYLYSYLGKREKSAKHLTRIVRELFTAEADGFPGDEDTGTMAAWYIFTVLGFYPLCPGKAEFVLGQAQVPYAKVRLSNGNELIVEAKGNKEVSFNGKTLAENKIGYAGLMSGGRLKYE